MPRTPHQQPSTVVELRDIPPAARELAELFEQAGYVLYLVGGSVRDALLGRESKDLDFCTDAHPEQILAIVEGWADVTWTTGITFGTVGANKAGTSAEITTWRADAYDRMSRNPIVRYGQSLNDDLSRRDFTINAMAVRLSSGEFADPFGGMKDLIAKTIRTPGRPEDSFSDDPLRMLRAARFVSTLGFFPAPEVVTAMTAMASEIERITAERVQEELSKLLMGSDPIAGLRLFVATGLAGYVLPELPALRLTIDEHHQHKDVYEHTLTVLRQAIDHEDGEPDLVLRLAAVMHDIGKPATRRFEKSGGVSFHHHDVVGAKMTRKRLRALRFPKDVSEAVAKLVFLHLRFYGYGRGEWTDSAVRRYVTDAGELLPRLHKLVRSDCTTRNKVRAAALSATYDELEERIVRIQNEEDLARIRPDLNGDEIMELLNIPPGPRVGQAWKYLKELRMERGPLDRDEAVEALLLWAQDQKPNK